ncbi:MAG TPA: glycoside hydrolase TIM-barrel-like domain-containing protein, partial [Paracoccaceae bacterium]|nr:glycoside hydrolase TIM-barrel-like domain-containing protein [Paracoccaceae bacterium]
MFYPFVLMEIPAGNTLADPWNAGAYQPKYPWRGRITTSTAAGQLFSPDQSNAAGSEVDAFFGNAVPSDFEITEAGVSYTGPAEWSYRRFILHYAHLCAKAGGIEGFLVGSELRGLTQIRDSKTGYPFVRKLIALAADVREILGPDVKILYAADWSEYFGHQPQDGSGDVLFNLDPLWADENIDFVGIDNYVPLSDWRDGEVHADSEAGSIYDLKYLHSNILGGEGYDWYYADGEHRAAQLRSAIVDGAYGEDWVFRYKDFPNWWNNQHFNRIDGLREVVPTNWEPRSKPIRFTELGCPAIDKGTNQPNVFVDPKSDESALPYYSDGGQDELIQARYLQAMYGFWGDDANNPESNVYDGRMVDVANSCVWAWDARPYPAFPARTALWSDGPNYLRGHWVNGRASAMGLAGVVARICARSNVPEVDVSGLYGLMRGTMIADTETARQSLQP